MNAQQAWQAALGYLQKEMSKVNYETWLGETELVSHEDNLVIIGVNNEYTRDWLESRLTNTIQRLLTGFMGESSKVNFIVNDPFSKHSDIRKNPELNNLDVVFPKLDHPEKIWQWAFGKLQRDLSNAEFETWMQNTEFVRFDDNTFWIGVKNAYAREWLEINLTRSAQTILTDVAGIALKVKFVIWQSKSNLQPDLLQGNNGEPINQIETIGVVIDREGDYNKVVKPDKKVVVLPGYFVRHIHRMGPDLAWMVVGFKQGAYLSRKLENDSYHIPYSLIADFSGSDVRTIKRRCKKTVTWEKLEGFVEPIDQEKKYYYVDTKGRPHQEANKYKVNAIIPLTPVDAKSLQEFLINQQKASGSLSAAIEIAEQTLLEKIIPWNKNLKEKETGKPMTVYEVIMGLGGTEIEAARIQEHLMPSKDILVISHYFFKWLKKLGSYPSWIIAVLRDRCYGKEVGTASSSFQELADILGISPARVRTVQDYFKREDMKRFVQVIDVKRAAPSFKRRFNILKIEPLLESDANVTHRETLSDANVTHKEFSNDAIVTHRESDAFVTHRRALTDANVTHGSEISDANVTVNLLNPLSSLKAINLFLPSALQKNNEIRGDDPFQKNWDRKELLEQKSKDPKVLKVNISRGISAEVIIFLIVFSVFGDWKKRFAILPISRHKKMIDGVGGYCDNLRKLNRIDEFVKLQNEKHLLGIVNINRLICNFEKEEENGECLFLNSKGFHKSFSLSSFMSDNEKKRSKIAL
ncbi:MAG: hypothetical protein JEZ06_15025 [Anaerolineaceae bacterium]|nr:hypothetical protein [Anaerolineaceae bacterium]